MAGYPERPKFFAHRFCRLLIKSCAAQEIGAEGCWLLTVIAHTEDAKHYKGPVTFWNEQLMPLCAFGSRATLTRARNKAIESGWLHYEAGTKGKAGKYWVLVPGDLEDLDDLPTDENQDEFRSESERQSNGKGDIPVQNCTESDLESAIPFRNCTANETECERNALHNADGMRAPFYPNPNPIPNPKNKRARADPMSAQVEVIYQAYPRKVAKQAALKAIRKALDNIEFDELLEAVTSFSRSPKARGGFCPYPATWFNQSRWLDDRREWDRESDASQPKNSAAYDPHAKEKDPTHGTF